MCGFCGVVSQESGQELASVVTAMTRTLAHRGPDGQGVYAVDGVALGHRRLSVIDLSDNGAQPMTAGVVTVAYNGEIYNFRSLRDALVRAGRTFRGHSDTEVLLQTYQADDLDGLSSLEGMFAFALWDASKRRLVLMRDRLGIKPLYYSWRNGRLVFGSEIKAVLRAGGIDETTDEQALSEYLWFGHVLEDRTFYQGVRALRPGHRLILEDGRVRIEPWWRIEEWLSSGSRVGGDPATDVREALDAAVDRQLVSDVPVGLFLSGGIDSSAIAASAATSAPGGRHLASFSVGFDFEKERSELPKARRVAAMFGLKHHEIRIAGGGLEDVIRALVRAHDEPFADAANIPLYLLAQGLNGEVKVVLQGDGGDEMFAGYRRYAILRHHAAWRWWPAGLGRAVTAGLGAPGARLARLAAAASSRDAARRMALLLTVETLDSPPTRMFRAERQRALLSVTDPFLAYARCAERFAHAEPVQQMLLTDICLQLPSQFLPKVDRATMAHSIEARVPFLDEKVASLAVGMDSRLKVRGRQKKIVLRDAMRPRVPADVLDGPKSGFGVPFEHWLKTSLHEFARAAILSPRFVDRFDLDADALHGALETHRAGRRDHGFLLWKLLQLALWAER